MRLPRYPNNQSRQYFFYNLTGVLSLSAVNHKITKRNNVVFRIGRYKIASQVVVAPMAGVTDRPYRRCCRAWGAGLAFAEMVSADPALRSTRLSQLRTDFSGESDPVVAQLVGYDPTMLADAARYNVDRGAQIIDINMGCPSKKVCQHQAGSALMADPVLVARILAAVVGAIDQPVTLKMRTGPIPDQRNAVEIAHIAEQSGVQALTIHGRTRACRFNGEAEYDTIRQVSELVTIPVIANGDIDSPQKARQVLDQTRAQAVMIGRAALGKPWLFQQIEHYLNTGQQLADPEQHEKANSLLQHLQDIHQFYPSQRASRIARKHLQWSLKQITGGERLWNYVKRIDSAPQQQQIIRAGLQVLTQNMRQAA